ncbi:carboxylesterase family protein [Sediminibacillus dalangtanensis]|uniref:Carboxylic ester hydrolase n=1 Tax=Sediminibacillus dalangtanensis TaxID=2729421 RepID=A0ABX7VVD8_9BACI|nr:carboxylesterase/lipase family protein [Sediminibacillus dalangtanensis]QTM99745.1 carboxylesterase family protein [Sediminibacillus dalangtanensis]
MDKILAETKQGQLKGKIEGKSISWKGIPYAKAPVGKLRFEPPQQPDNWQGVREAFDFGPVCPQPPEAAAMQGINPEDMSEDCLYLNVWTPNTSKKDLPVMVWIHGGAFTSGAGSSYLYNGARLAVQGEVVVVTLNYRLGALGFLHLAGLDDHFTANLGLLDQVAALRWVKNNIAVFGGDPQQVTIFGESAGSMSIASLFAMPQAKGLFNKAIMESGASQVVPSGQAVHIAKDFISMLDIEPDHLSAIKDESLDSLMKASEEVYQENGGDESVLLFQPAIDDNTLPQYPTDAVAAGSAADIPLMIGTNHDEGVFFVRPDTEEMPEGKMDEIVKRMAGRENADKIREYYPPSAEGQARLITDFVFWKPALEFAEAQTNYAPVWMYRFDWHVPGHPYAGKAVHALEIPFVFQNLDYFWKLEVEVGMSLEKLSTRMQNAWVSFARTGEPGSDWPAYDLEVRKTKIFNESDRIIADPHKEKRRIIQDNES